MKICQIRGSLLHSDDNPEPSPVNGGEGVETKRQTPLTTQVRRVVRGEEIVQLTKSKDVAKAIVRSITTW